MLYVRTFAALRVETTLVVSRRGEELLNSNNNKTLNFLFLIHVIVIIIIIITIMTIILYI